jgi:hypothetical protein
VGAFSFIEVIFDKVKKKFAQTKIYYKFACNSLSSTDGLWCNGNTTVFWYSRSRSESQTNVKPQFLSFLQDFFQRTV